MTLTSKQRAFLNSQAHSLKPIIQIGKNGLNDQIKTSVRQALDARELIKKIARFLRKSKKFDPHTPNNCFYREIKETSLWQLNY